MHQANRLVAGEFEILLRLHEADRDKRFIPFLPNPAASIHYQHTAGQAARLGNALNYFDGVGDPDSCTRSNRYVPPTQMDSMHATSHGFGDGF
jgi:hypothetical protein